MENFDQSTPESNGQPSSTIQPWSVIFRGLLFKALFVAILGTGLVLLSGTGMLTTNGMSNIEPDGTFAGTIAAICPAIFTLLAVEFNRRDSGLRPAGLTRLFMITTFCAIAIQLMFMACWPIAVVQESWLRPVAAEYLSDPKSFVLTACFVSASYFWSSLALVGLTSGKRLGNLVGVLYLIMIIALGVVQGISLFGSPSIQSPVALWIVLALVGGTLQPLASHFSARNIQAGLADLRS